MGESPEPWSASAVSPRLFYRTLAIAEAITWTGLIAAMVLKYGFGVDAFIAVAGGLHGLVFLSYAFTAVLVGVNQRWSLALIALAVATAIVPYATIPFDIWADRSGRLDGEWRRAAGDHPHDESWVNCTLRWFLGHLVVLALVAVVGIGGIMAVLLTAGPPGEW
jgi:integral membrane protein